MVALTPVNDTDVTEWGGHVYALLADEFFPYLEGILVIVERHDIVTLILLVGVDLANAVEGSGDVDTLSAPDSLLDFQGFLQVDDCIEIVLRDVVYAAYAVVGVSQVNILPEGKSVDFHVGLVASETLLIGVFLWPMFPKDVAFQF